MSVVRYHQASHQSTVKMRLVQYMGAGGTAVGVLSGTSRVIPLQGPKGPHALLQLLKLNTLDDISKQCVSTYLFLISTTVELATNLTIFQFIYFCIICF